MFCFLNIFYSAGVGRTGVTILCLQMLEKIKREEAFDIVEMFLNLRRQRIYMVETLVTIILLS